MTRASPVRTMVPNPNEPVFIREYAFEYEAELARAVLEAHGFPALVVRDSYEGLGAGPVCLAVRREDVEGALLALGSAATAAGGGSRTGQIRTPGWRTLAAWIGFR